MMFNLRRAATVGLFLTVSATYTFCSHDEKDSFDKHLQVVNRFLAEEQPK